jgi:hypothetical protein
MSGGHRSMAFATRQTALILPVYLSAKHVTTFALSVLFAVCCGAAELRANCSNGLELNLSVDPKVQDFHFWQNFQFFSTFPHVSGRLRIINNSASLKPFTTAASLLAGDGVAPRRGYVESVATHPIDFSRIDVQPGQSLDFQVYWMVPLELGATLGKPELSCLSTI